MEAFSSLSYTNGRNLNLLFSSDCFKIKSACCAPNNGQIRSFKNKMTFYVINFDPVVLLNFLSVIRSLSVRIQSFLAPKKLFYFYAMILFKVFHLTE